jgi:RNA polymerase sigma-70 factor (ECF subfamily)
MTASEITVDEERPAVPETSDSELLARMIEGDEDSFTAIYRRRQGAIYRFALHMTGSVAAAEDVTQEVFLALIKHGRRFDAARGTLAPFLYGIARNFVLRRLGEDRKTKEEDPEQQFAPDDDPFANLARRETIESVRRAVLSLPLVYREAVVLCDLEDTSYEDAAIALDCPIGTIRSRLSRARTMLAEKLGKRPGGAVDGQRASQRRIR